MEGTQKFLELVRDHHLAAGNLRGVFHIAVGRTLTLTDGTVLSKGVTWRQLATILKSIKFDKTIVEELGEIPEELSPKDREKYWYTAISHAKVDSAESRQQAEELVPMLAKLGVIVGPAPGQPARMVSHSPSASAISTNSDEHSAGTTGKKSPAKKKKT